MTLRAKLLLLLATVALIPLLLLTVLQYETMAGLARQLQAESRKMLSDGLTSALGQSVDTNAYALDHSAETVSLTLQLMAEEIEKRLAAPPQPAATVYENARFASRAEWPPGTRLASLGGSTPIPLTFDYPSVVYAPGSDPAAVRADAARLVPLTPVLRSLYAQHKTSVNQLFVGLTNGLFLLFPGHAEPAGYDHRHRAWYLTGLAANGTVWTPPMYSASTAQLTVVAARPVHRPDGSIAGVAAADIAVLFVLQRLQHLLYSSDSTTEASLDHLIARTDSILVQPRQGDLRVLARREYQQASPDWRADVKLGTIAPDDPRVARTVYAEIAAGRRGVLRLRYQGLDVLWAYCPVRAMGGALLFSLPFSRVTDEAAALNATLRKSTIAQLDVSIALGVILVLAVVAVAVVVASLASRPIRKLAEAAARIGSGDLSARADVAGSDEIGALGAAFNAMVPKLAEGLRMRSSLELARAVQQNLLPAKTLRIGPFDVAGASRYCDETGGDYYDFMDLSNGSPRVAVAVGDVSGHGIAAALLMASARALVRSSLGEMQEPAASMGHTNRLLSEDIQDGNFMTMALLVIDAAGRSVRWVNAAHDASLVLDVANGAFVPLDGGDLPLGIESAWRFTEHTLRLPEGHVVIAAGTDGIWEARNDRGEAFGRERLCESILRHAGRNAGEICERVIADLETFRNGAAQDDDVTLVIVTLDPAAGPGN